ncbi:translation initiation factor SUI1 domain-containing protein, putative [Eimeria brunetti]|uniref:Translation initiation factor SUI1 domain-containing protein, putative n=1 Tax=Eimeria brunetti TaxID=51314 RepID=U6LFX4_9EIME|nr:translation initiation factor SUI1 domain-containing protein, putative [Eimeria brunetti]
MDAHDSDSGSGGEAPALSNRTRRKLQMQQKQQNQEKQEMDDRLEPAGTAAPTHTATGETGSQATNDSWARDYPPMTGPCKVEYCPTCSMPFEYCEFSGEACSKQGDKPEEDPNDQASAMQQKEDEQQLSIEFEEKSSISAAKGGAGKRAGAKPQVVTVQKQAKRRGKHVTNVWGLEHFGVKQEQAARLASKQFACGASFQKGQPGQMPFVEIQGDVGDTIKAFLKKNFNVPEDKIVILAEK